MHYEVISNAHYSGYLEYGTRYMNKEPFIFPTYLSLKTSKRRFRKINKWIGVNYDS